MTQHGQQQRRLGAGGRARVLTAAVVLAAAVLLLGPVRALPAPDGTSVPVLLALVAALVVAELAQVHWHLRATTHTVTFTEVPLVAGLLLVGPWQLALAQLGAVVLARVLWVRQRPVQQVFNAALAVLDVCVLVLVVALLAPAPDATSPRTWAAVLAAALVTALVSATCVGLVAATPAAPGRRRADLTRLVHTSWPVLGVTVVNTAAGLMIASVLTDTPGAAVALVVPTGVLLLGYRAYAAQLHERERVAFLLAFHRRLHESATPEEGLDAALALAATTLRTTRLELVGTGGANGAGALAELAATARGGGRRLTLRSERRDRTRVGALLVALGADQALVAPLPGGGRHPRALVAVGRVAGAARFGEPDVALLDAMAEQLALVLERDALAGTVDTLRELQQRLEHTASHDELTGLANRRHLLEQVGWHLAARAATGAQPTVLFIDIDGFKGVNDRLGHAAGDALLVEAAARLSALLGPQDLVARLGGDEFVVVLHDTADDHAALAAATRACEALRAPLDIDGRPAAVGASVGVARAAADVTTAEELLQRADEAMYAVKARSGGVQLYDAAAHAARSRRRALQEALAGTLADDLLQLSYQPIVCLGTGEVVGAEALARWTHPALGEVTPDVFVELAESTGQIVDLGRSVLRSACRQLATWQRTHPRRALSLAVNVSVRELQHEAYADVLAGVLAETGAHPGGLVLEVTEAAGAEGARSVASQLTALRAMGVQVAVDDFGAGEASLAQLRSLPADLVKLDRSLVHGALTSASGLAVLRAVVRMGADLGLVVVAEGVETPEHEQLCRDLGVPLGQGWLLGRPGSADDLEALLGTPRPALHLERVPSERVPVTSGRGAVGW